MRSVMETSLASSYPPVVRHDPDTFAAFRARWLGNDPESFAAINRMLAADNIEHELSKDRLPGVADRRAARRPAAAVDHRADGRSKFPTRSSWN